MVEPKSFIEIPQWTAPGAIVKALDPILSRLRIVSILADGDVCPTVLPRSLS